MRVTCFFILLVSVLQAQQSDTVQLKDMFFSDIRLPLVSKIQEIKVLNDSVIKSNGTFLTQLLQHNSGIYFRENGFGMTSSASFRGTTAQQTEVLWNGISVNSKFLGQTDFNAISTQTYNNVLVKPGGASVIYGSGAIGGTIHLNQILKFNQPLTHEIRMGYGSFNTTNGLYNLKWGKRKWATELGYGFNTSENNFKWDSPAFKNENGQYYNHTFSFNTAFRPNNKNEITLFSQGYKDQRHFSLFSSNQTKTKYQNKNTRVLLQWNRRDPKLNHNLSLAFLNEEFRYFENIKSSQYTRGIINSYVAKYTAKYQVNKKISINGLVDFNNDKAIGKRTGIKKPTQNKIQLAGLFSHSVNDILLYELGLKKVFVQDFTSPLLFSVGLRIKENDFSATKINFSKNYRQPSFNDLYWQPGGNTNLKAESALQGELIQELNFKSLQLSITGFYYDIRDMIRWVPTENQFWKPLNTDYVTSYGTDLTVSFQKSWNHQQLLLTGNYAFTQSKNKKTGKQLPYIPNNKGSFNVSYSFWRLNTFLQSIYVGSVFTQSDNRNQLGDYAVLNWGLRYSNPKKIQWEIGFNINNITNTRYEVVEYYPMPPLHYKINFNIKI